MCEDGKNGVGEGSDFSYQPLDVEGVLIGKGSVAVMLRQ